MSRTDFTYLSNDGKTNIHAVEWKPAGEIKAILQISHGMAEYIMRYNDFAEFLNTHGILVVGNDHLGHGESVNSKENLGYFSEDNANQTVLNDIHKLKCLTKEKYPSVPYILMGHSMGSFYARQYIAVYGGELDAAIIMGTGYQSPALVGAAKCFTRIIALFHGWKYRSKFMDNLVFASNNKTIENSRTPLDWLSRKAELVDAYIADELCGFGFTLNAYRGMFDCLGKIVKPGFLAKMPKDLPVLFVSGDADPVGSKDGEGVKKVTSLFKEAGMKNAELKLYHEYRHEILNELENEAVYKDILGFISKQNS